MKETPVGILHEQTATETTNRLLGERPHLSFVSGANLEMTPSSVLHSLLLLVRSTFKVLQSNAVKSVGRFLP